MSPRLVRCLTVASRQEIQLIVNPKIRRTLTAAFNTLYILHSKNIYHGDARFPNLLQVGDDHLWVDFLAGQALEVDRTVFIVHARGDMRTCASSALNGKMVDAVTAAIDVYDVTKETVEPIVNAVWEVVKSTQ